MTEPAPRVSDERLSDFIEDNEVAFDHLPTCEVPIAVLLGRDLRDARAEVTRLRTELEAANAALKRMAGNAVTVCDAFDAKLFVRDVSGDTDEGWAMKYVRPISALVALAAESRRVCGPPEVEP